MYVTQYVDNTRYGQSSVAEYAGYLEKESLIQSQLDETSSRQLSATMWSGSKAESISSTARAIPTIRRMS